MSLVPIQMGNVIKSASIKRADVAQGTKGRAVLIDPNPRAANIAFDNDLKMAVYVTQEDVIRYGLSPRTYYMLLLARLNTDMQGTVVGDGFIVEYVKMSDTVYDEFMDHYVEMENVNSITLKKESKGGGANSYSYVVPMASKEKVDPAILAKIAELDAEALWSLVTVDCARPIEDYVKALSKANEASGQQVYNRQIESNQRGQAQIGASPRNSQRVQAPVVDVAKPQQPILVESNDFAEAEETGDFD
jgi:hypothetical protein